MAAEELPTMTRYQDKRQLREVKERRAVARAKRELAKSGLLFKRSAQPIYSPDQTNHDRHLARRVIRERIQETRHGA